MWPRIDQHRPFGLEDIVTNLLAHVINRIDGIDKADKQLTTSWQTFKKLFNKKQVSGGVSIF